MKNAARLTLVLAALVLAAAPLALAADAVQPVGTWDAVATTPNGDMASVLVIKQVDGGLKAEMELDGVPRTITDEKLEGDVFRMRLQYEGGIYDIEVKIAGDTLEGTWQGSGYSGTLKARRRS
jgi:opacity protein-like surface antigen